MSRKELFPGVPKKLVEEGRLEAFSPFYLPYPPLMGHRVEGNACNLSPNMVKQMPLDSTAIFTVETHDQSFPIQVVKTQSIPYQASLRLVSSSDERYKLEAHIQRLQIFYGVVRSQKLPFLRDLTSDAKIMKYDLVAKINNQHLPPLRAKEFLSWALKVFSDYHITHLLAEWEPDSDNHATFYQGVQKRNNEVSAVKQTWTHAQFTNLGFELIPKIGIVPIDENVAKISGNKKSPFGFPKTVVYALYRKKGK